MGETFDDGMLQIFNSFSALDCLTENQDMQHLILGGGGIRSMESSPTHSTRETIVSSLRRWNSMENISVQMASEQQLRDFKNFLDNNQKGSILLLDKCPRGAMIDAKDIVLLNNLHKISGRPTNYNKKLHHFFFSS